MNRATLLIPALLLIVSSSAPCAWGQQQNWTAATNDARYGQPSGSPPASMTNPVPARSDDITPLPGGPPASGGLSPLGQAPSANRAKVTNGASTLPNSHGQVMREYDIRPYTLRVSGTEHPEQTIVDWVLRETGYESWHSEPLGLLSAQPRHPAGLPHAGNAGCRRGHCGPLRQQPARGPRLLAADRDCAQPELARQGDAPDDAGAGAVARHAGLDPPQGKRGDADGRPGAHGPTSASTAPRATWRSTGVRRCFPLCVPGNTSRGSCGPRTPGPASSLRPGPWKRGH